MTDRPPGRLCRAPYAFPGLAGTKYAYCRCQQSSRFPLCDGTHRQIGDGTDFTPIKVIPDQDVTLVWCACGRSSSKPDCDGSHAGSGRESIGR